MMRYHFKYLFVFIATCAVSGILTAQSTVSGMLTDAETQEPLIGAYLKISTLADSTNSFGVSDYEGKFSIDVFKEGDYFAEISYVGYELLQKTFSVNGDTDLGIINLSIGSTALAEVEVTAIQERVSQKGDTTQYNAAAYGSNPNAAAEDLLQKMPGFVVTDGKMQVQGENITKILVNGKPFFGDDPDMALKNLPAEIISKIEVYNQSNDEEENSDDAGNEGPKTINIILKEEYNNGVFGNVYGGYGLEDKYKAGLNFNHFKGNRRINVLGQFNNINKQNFSSADLLGVTSSTGKGKKGGASSKSFFVPRRGGINTTNAGGINYQNYWGKKIELSGSYFFNQSENINETFLTREYFNRALPFAIEEESTDKSENVNHRLNVLLRYKINDKNSISFKSNVTIQQNKGTSVGMTQSFTNDTLTNTFSDDFRSDLFALNSSSKLVYTHRFNKKKRSLNINLKNNLNASNGKTFSNSYKIHADSENSLLLDQNSILDDSKQFYEMGIRLNEPVGKKGKITIGYTYGNEENVSEILTSAYNEISENYDLLDEILSSQFNNEYQSHRGEISYKYRKRKLRFTLRGRFQSAVLNNVQDFPAESTTQKVFKNFLPDIRLQYNFSKDKNLRLSFNSRTQLPKIADLQDVIDNSNPLRITAGNSGLSQQVSHNFELKYSANNSKKGAFFFAYLKSSYHENYIGRSLIFTSETDTLNGVIFQEGAQFKTPINLSGYFNTRAFVTYGMPLSSLKSNFNINIGASHKRIPSQIDSTIFFANIEKIKAGVVLSSNISPEIDFTIKSTSYFDFSQNDNADNTKIYNQKTQVSLNYIFGNRWQINSTITHRYYNTFGGEPIDDFILWNASFGYKFLKDRRGELGLTLYDVLDSNVAVRQTYNENSYTQKESLVLSRFFMLTFRYNIRTFD